MYDLIPGLSGLDHPVSNPPFSKWCWWSVRFQLKHGDCRGSSRSLSREPGAIWDHPGYRTRFVLSLSCSLHGQATLNYQSLCVVFQMKINVDLFSDLCFLVGLFSFQLLTMSSFHLFPHSVCFRGSTFRVFSWGSTFRVVPHSVWFHLLDHEPLHSAVRHHAPGGARRFLINVCLLLVIALISSETDAGYLQSMDLSCMY